MVFVMKMQYVRCEVENRFIEVFSRGISGFSICSFMHTYQIVTNTLIKFCRYSGTRVLKTHHFQIREFKFIVNEILVSK
jgi:protein tyrosine phosphatase (PTP) superfamily phosphohydrolase (DUF442 family)